MDTVTIIRLILIALQFAIVIWSFIILYRSERKRISYEKDLEKNNPYVYAVVRGGLGGIRRLAFFEDACNALKTSNYYEKNRRNGNDAHYFIQVINKKDYKEFVNSNYNTFEDFLDSRKEGTQNE